MEIAPIIFLTIGIVCSIISIVYNIHNIYEYNQMIKELLEEEDE